MKNSRVQEPNVETDHLESSTSGSANLLKNQSFDPRFQPTRQDVCWSGGHALLHQVVQNQPDGQVCSAYQRQGTCVQFQQWRPTENAVTVPLTPHPSSTSKMGEHSHLRASALPFYPWYGGAMWLQSSQIQHPHWCSHVQ